MHQIVLLPQSHHNTTTWRNLIAKQKELRLQALRLSPDSFSSTYDREVAFSDYEWEVRLQNPLAFTFIAVELPNDQSPNGDDCVLTESEWDGFGVLFGPVGEDGSSSSDNVTTGQECPTFGIFGLYVLPDVRKVGVGKKLTEAIIEHGKLLAKEKGAGDVVFKISAAPTNVAALRLYENLGFRAGGSAVVSSERMGAVAMEMKCSV
jgi:ribosomal protein S18 acetylase RimI-like enzyme